MMKMMAGGAGGPPGKEGEGGFTPAEQKSMETLMQAMTSGDPEQKKQMEGMWKMLDEMATSKPEEYKSFIDGQMTDMNSHHEEEEKKEELKWSIQSEAYFSFCVRPAKILEHNKNDLIKEDNNIKLFDFGQNEEIKESFAANRETTEPLDGPKLYLNVVHHERVLPPLNADKNLADTNVDTNWNIIPLCFSVPIKRRNLNNIECWHFDCHINTCVTKMMSKGQDRMRAIWNYIIMRFQNHLKNQFLFHKQSIKIVKKRKYKNAIGSGQRVKKFILPKEFEKDFYIAQKKKMEERKKQA